MGTQVPRVPNYYSSTRDVFKSLRKLSLVTLGSFKLSRNEFQADGPATEKARRP